MRSMFDDIFETIPHGLARYFMEAQALWKPLDHLEEMIADHQGKGSSHIEKGSIYIEGDVYIGNGTVIEHGAVILGPVFIGSNCHIRAGAYIRGPVYISNNCIIGHTTEMVRSILFDKVRLDHFNYVGDSILGNSVHFGAGAKVANLRFDEKEITIEKIPTGRNKLGVILGDNCQLGVNVSIGPGVILKKGTWVPSKDQRKSGIYSKGDI